MTRLRSWAWTLIVPALIWAVLSWPLPRYAGRGIPMSSQNIERQSARAMIPGDHLQLLYHFQLVEDFLEGRIPFFHNVYEFNTGRDEDRYQPGSYYAPFSLAYAALARVLPAAGAWNGVGFLSLWATFAATLAYLRNFTRSSAAAWLGAIISILLPYRWVNLLGGSPSGFAMVWPPVIVWLMDRAIRNGRTRDGVFCGIALLLACWGDLQAFFFATLSLPFWALLSAADAGWLRRPFPWAEVRARIRGARLGVEQLVVGLFIVIRDDTIFLAHVQLFGTLEFLGDIVENAGLSGELCIPAPALGQTDGLLLAAADMGDALILEKGIGFFAEGRIYDAVFNRQTVFWHLVQHRHFQIAI